MELLLEDAWFAIVSGLFGRSERALAVTLDVIGGSGLKTVIPCQNLKEAPKSSNATVYT